MEQKEESNNPMIIYGKKRIRTNRDLRWYMLRGQSLTDSFEKEIHFCNQSHIAVTCYTHRSSQIWNDSTELVETQHLADVHTTAYYGIHGVLS